MQIHITYRLTRDLDEDAGPVAMACLSAEERARCSQLVSSADRRDFAAAHVLLRQSLSAREPLDPGQWAFARSPTGKPRLDHREEHEGGLAFNLSHTRGLVACVITRGAEVGIDVERVSASADLLDLARDHFSLQEFTDLERFEANARAKRFAELWTLKEAYVKATGAGLLGASVAPAFTFGEADSLSFQPVAASEVDAWDFAVFGVLDYRLAVAIRNPRQNVMTLLVNQTDKEGSRNGIEPRLLRMSRPTVVVSGT